MSETKELGAEFWVGLFSPVIFASLTLVMMPFAILRAYVMTKLWDWYLVPAFGAAPLRLVYAFGLVLIVAFLSTKSASKDAGLGKSSVKLIFEVAIVLSIGWLGTWFI